MSVVRCRPPDELEFQAADSKPIRKQSKTGTVPVCYVPTVLCAKPVLTRRPLPGIFHLIRFFLGHLIILQLLIFG
jgi:hypothetical protein